MGDATTRFFDAMAASYDELEPWYEHLYAELHRILRSTLGPAPPGARALDAGCGTGFQTGILAELGYRSHGLDLSGASLSVARARLSEAGFVRGDLGALPYDDAIFDAVVCAGSTLDFVDEPGRAVSEIARVMRPGARLLLEYERRWCPDIAWALLSSVTADAFGYGLRPAEARTLVASPWRTGVWVDYPGYPPLRLFTDRELGTMLESSGLHVEQAWGIHAITNLMPSPVLHRSRLPALLRPLYRALRSVDARLGSSRGIRAMAAHGVVLARRS
jgi:SAM-dependent methyltransferase